MGITSWALGDENYKTLQDLEAEYSAKYPGMDTSGGVFSDARHAAATNLMSDRLGGGWLGDTAANIGGAAREVPTFVSEAMGLTPSGQSWEDLQANTLAYDYGKGTSAADIYADVFSKYDQSQKAALSNPNYAYGTAQAGHDDWVPKKTGPDPFMATPYLMSKASNLGQSAMHSTPTYDTSDSYLYSTSSGEPVPLPPQLRKPETNWYDGIMNALNPSKADVLARLQANNPAFKGDYYTSRQPSGPWDTGEWGPGPKSDLSDPSGDAFDFEFKEDSTVIDENRIPGRVQESVPNYQNWKDKFSNLKMPSLGIGALTGMFKESPEQREMMELYNSEDYQNLLNQIPGMANYNPVYGMGSGYGLTNAINKRLATLAKTRKRQGDDFSATLRKREEDLKKLAALEASKDFARIGASGRRPGSGGPATHQDTAAKGGYSPGQAGAGTGGYSYDSGGRQGYGYGLKYGGRVRFSDGGLATLFTRRG